MPVAAALSEPCACVPGPDLLRARSLGSRRSRRRLRRRSVGAVAGARPSSRRPGSARRGPRCRFPSSRRDAVPDLVRLRAPGAGAPRSLRLRPPGVGSPRAPWGAAGRRAGVLRDGGRDRSRASRPSARDRGLGDHRGRGQRELGRRPGTFADLSPSDRQRELLRLRAAHPSAHARDGTGHRRPDPLHASSCADDAGDPRHLLRASCRPARRRLVPWRCSTRHTATSPSSR